MKRKIEAKMKNRGMASNDGAVQRIAMSIVDNSETVQTPASTTPKSPGDSVQGSPHVEKNQPPISTPNDDSRMSDIPSEDDEESRILAELEAERQAEERARQKRRELEERLASARIKKTQRSVSAHSEGNHQSPENNTAMQDSTSSLC
jgi:hypothetical protein